MNDKHIVTLLEIQLKHDRVMDRLDKAFDGHCDVYEMFPLDLLDIVADLLGVPEDNTLEHYNEDTATYTDGCYCRDWVHDTWCDCRDLEDPIESFIDTMKSHTEEYYKETKK